MLRNFFAASRAAPASMLAPSTAAAAFQRRSTTILCVRKNGKVVMMGDRQVTLGERIVAKATARKLRRLCDGTVVVGFAGSTADALTLVDKLESKLGEYKNQLLRAAVELAKDWRTDKALRRLEASLIVADKAETLEIDGQGNVITPEEDGIIAIGSGGPYARAAARALIDVEGMEAEQIASKAMKIATDIDVFSNSNWDKEIITQQTPAPQTVKVADKQDEKKKEEPPVVVAKVVEVHHPDDKKPTPDPNKKTADLC